jgi:peroxiredoxin
MKTLLALAAVVVSYACATGKAEGQPASAEPASRIPPAARRLEPPPELEATAKKIGDEAPAFELVGDDGESRTLDGALQDGPVVLVFYRGDWCPYCRTQLQGLQERIGDFRAKKATLFAISVDSVERNRALADELGLDFPILADPDRAVIRAYGVDDPENRIAWPAIFVIGRDGTIVDRDLAVDYRVRPQVAAIIEAIPR